MTNKINNNDILLPGDLYVACGREHFALYSDYAVLDSDSTSWVTGSMPADLQEKYKIALQKHNRSRSSTSCSDRDNDSIGLVDSENTECDIDLLSEFPYTVQHGHLETPVPCTISFRFHTPSIADTKSSPGCDVVIKMRRPEWAICPGQVAAIYAGSVCLGGGKVKSFGNSNDSFVELQ